jgi:hypothetical protein
MSTLYAAATKRLITPTLGNRPVFLAGFQANRPAAGVHDDLYVRTIALSVQPHLESDSHPPYLVLAVCDLIGLLRADVLLIRRSLEERGIDTQGVVVASTHVHSGPDTIGLWGPSRFRSGVNARYQGFVRSQFVESIVEAIQSLKPARLRGGRTGVDRWLKNARDPEIVDREMGVLGATMLDGRPIFTLVNLACHPEVMFGENNQITADYAGSLCREIEAQAGGTAAFASADIGGMMTPDVSGPDRTFATVEQMGRDIAAFALKALQAGQEIAPRGLRCWRQMVELPLDNPLFRFSLAIGVLPRLPGASRRKAVTEVMLLDVDPVRIVTIPGELLPGPGMHLRAALGSPYPFLIGLANDELGYLLPSNEFVFPPNPFRPGAHYEETMSPSQYATPLLMEAWMALIARASSEESSQ